MPRARFGINVSLTAVLAAMLAGPAGASGDDWALCLEAAAEAAQANGVPYDVLLAVALVETGRDGKPWPWTVNIGGEGHWLATAADAADLVKQALDAGTTNLDLGCFQLNLYWHAQNFTSIEDMLDPIRNATYAAGYLAEKFGETGDWSLAAAAYHSATPDLADAYQVRFAETLASVQDTGTADLRIAEVRPNRFPLFLAGQAGSPGSLVPATSGGLRLIGGP